MKFSTYRSELSNGTFKSMAQKLGTLNRMQTLTVALREKLIVV